MRARYGSPVMSSTVGTIVIFPCSCHVKYNPVFGGVISRLNCIDSAHLKFINGFSIYKIYKMKEKPCKNADKASEADVNFVQPNNQ